jgi:hypothetical protein
MMSLMRCATALNTKDPVVNLHSILLNGQQDEASQSDVEVLTNCSTTASTWSGRANSTKAKAVLGEPSGSGRDGRKSM